MGTSNLIKQIKLFRYEIGMFIATFFFVKGAMWIGIEDFIYINPNAALGNIIFYFIDTLFSILYIAFVSSCFGFIIRFGLGNRKISIVNSVFLSVLYIIIEFFFSGNQIILNKFKIQIGLKIDYLYFQELIQVLNLIYVILCCIIMFTTTFFFIRLANKEEINKKEYGIREFVSNLGLIFFGIFIVFKYFGEIFISKLFSFNIVHFTLEWIFQSSVLVFIFVPISALILSFTFLALSKRLLKKPYQSQRTINIITSITNVLFQLSIWTFIITFFIFFIKLER